MCDLSIPVMRDSGQASSCRIGLFGQGEFVKWVEDNDLMATSRRGRAVSARAT